MKVSKKQKQQTNKQKPTNMKRLLVPERAPSMFEGCDDLTNVK